MRQNKLFLERMLDWTPRLFSRGVFYRDDGQSFADVLFYGNEVSV